MGSKNLFPIFLNGDRAQVTLIEPTAGLLSQNAGNAFAVKVYPLILRTVQAIGQVFQAF